MGSPSLHHQQLSSQVLSQLVSQVDFHQPSQLWSQDPSLRASRGSCEGQRWGSDNGTRMLAYACYTRARTLERMSHEGRDGDRPAVGANQLAAPRVNTDRVSKNSDSILVCVSIFVAQRWGACGGHARGEVRDACTCSAHLCPRTARRAGRGRARGGREGDGGGWRGASNGGPAARHVGPMSDTLRRRNVSRDI